MANPQLVYPQNPLNSKTVLVNIFGSVLVWLVTKYGLSAVFTPDVVNQIATWSALTIMGAANVVIRKYTSGALDFGAPMNQPSPRELPAGTHTITVIPPPPPVATNVTVVSQPLVSQPSPLPPSLNPQL